MRSIGQKSPDISCIIADENIIPAGKALVRQLAGVTVLWPGHPSVPDIPLGVKDPEFLARIGAAGHDIPIFTFDKHITSRPAELRMLRKHGVRAFIIRDPEKLSVSQKQIETLVLRYWDAIVERNAQTAAPYAYALWEDGLKRISLSTKRWNPLGNQQGRIVGSA